MKHIAARAIQVLSVLSVVAFSSGCSESRSESEYQARREKRMHAQKALLNDGPQVKTTRTTEGDIVELTIPREMAGGKFVEIKRCVVWRDLRTSTSAIHCDGGDDGLGS